MSVATKTVRSLAEIGRADAPIAGGKGANLGEMARAGLPVPGGFVVTVDAYQIVLGSGAAHERIVGLLQGLDPADAAGLQNVAESARQLIEAIDIPADLEREIRSRYAELQKDGEPPFVAVRSSATVEDSPHFSFAGMFQSFLNVRGADELLTAVKKCWASAFTARSLFYRLQQGMSTDQGVAVVVQNMVNSEKAGVMFTVDPATGNQDLLVIEAAWGLGEVVVAGQVAPDHYVVNKRTREILSRSIGHKDFMLVRDPSTGANTRVRLDEARATSRVLSDDEVRSLAELGLRDEAHYGAPQDAEWAIERDQVYLVQTRPVTTLARTNGTRTNGKGTQDGGPTLLVRGLGASPGQASGRVRVLSSGQEGRLEKGEVLVAAMTSPDWVPLMRKAAAIVTDSGGMTSHAAIVSRELGVPCVVGARTATQLLRDGTEVTVDGSAGAVYEGVISLPKMEPASATPAASANDRNVAGPLITGTRIYVNLAEPDLADAVAARDVDGVGLLRAEFMLLAALEGKHPRLLLESGRGDEFVDRMADKLRVFARAFAPRPVIYRSTDFKTNEFRGLEGGGRFEPEEANPMLGYRGSYRYTREADLFALELKALVTVHREFPNLQLMIPFVRTGAEFDACKRLIDASGLTGLRGFELWIMAEVPSVVAWLPHYAAAGVAAVSIGSNDLTQLILGVDRDSELLAELFDERDRAVMESIHAIIDACHRLGLKSSICGQAPSVYPEYAEQLVAWGIDSISVNPDVIEATRRNAAAAERRLTLRQARESLTRRGERSSSLDR